MPRNGKLKVKIDSAISTVSIARRNKKVWKKRKKRKPRCELINKRLLKEAISKEKPRLLCLKALVRQNGAVNKRRVQRAAISMRPGATSNFTSLATTKKLNSQMLLRRLIFSHITLSASFIQLFRLKRVAAVTKLLEYLVNFFL